MPYFKRIFFIYLFIYVFPSLTICVLDIWCFFSTFDNAFLGWHRDSASRKFMVPSLTVLLVFLFPLVKFDSISLLGFGPKLWGIWLRNYSDSLNMYPHVLCALYTLLQFEKYLRSWYACWWGKVLFIWEWENAAEAPHYRLIADYIQSRALKRFFRLKYLQKLKSTQIDLEFGLIQHHIPRPTKSNNCFCKGLNGYSAHVKYQFYDWEL